MLILRCKELARENSRGRIENSTAIKIFSFEESLGNQWLICEFTLVEFTCRSISVMVEYLLSSHKKAAFCVLYIEDTAHCSCTEVQSGVFWYVIDEFGSIFDGEHFLFRMVD